jgi:predicted dinucleotide-binding enzyme
MKKIGILGSGIVGTTLGSGFVKHGYDVMIGTRNSEKLEEWKNIEGQNAHIGSFEEAAAFGGLLVLACKGTAVESVLKAAEEGNLNGKTVIDATNPIKEAPPENGVLQFFTSFDQSLMERLQLKYPEAEFVKAFNSIGSHFMVNPNFKGAQPTMFICGNSETAKKEVSAILEVFGFETVDMGGVEAARAIEPLCMLYCIPGMLRNEWGHAFKLLKI